MKPVFLPVAALLLLAACPLPQSVPSVPPGSVTPPRIVEDASLTPSGTTVAFDPTCPTAQAFTVTATVADENFGEAVDYRYFVDYSPTDPFRYTPQAEGPLDAPTQEPFTLRPVKPDFVVRPAQFAPADATRVLELVVSNGFDKSPDQGALPLPNRTPLSDANNRYEVQSHKWVFVPVAGCAGTTCPACP